MSFVAQWSEEEWRRASLVGSEKVVQALLQKGRAEYFAASLGRDAFVAEVLDKLMTLSNEAVRLAENFEREKRKAVFDMTYEGATEDQRTALFRLETEFDLKCREAKAIAGDEIAQRLLSGEMIDWSIIERAQEWQRVYERLLAAERKYFESQVSCLGLNRRAAGNDAPSFWDELKSRCRESLIGPERPKEHPHVHQMTQIINEMAKLADQIKGLHMARIEPDGSANEPTL